MKLNLFLSLSLYLLSPIKIHSSTYSQFNTVCDSFAAGEIDARKTLEALKLNIEDYSIGVNNTAKIFCI